VVSDKTKNYFKDGYTVLSQSDQDRNGINIFPNLTPDRMNSLRSILLNQTNIPKALNSQNEECLEFGKGEWFSLEGYPTSAKVGVNCALKGNRY
jgi:hypothetical protein